MKYNCSQVMELLPQVAADPSDTVEGLQEHLDSCESCSAELDAYRGVLGRLHAAPELEPRNDLFSSIRAQIESNPLLTTSSEPESVLSALASHANVPDPLQTQPVRQARPRIRWGGLAMAAAILMMLVFGMISMQTAVPTAATVSDVDFVDVLSGSLKQDALPVGTVIRTDPRGPNISLSLEVGGTALVRPGSSLQFSAVDRVKLLSGTAYFEITPKGRGFSVVGASADATVTGTRFVVTSHSANGGETVLSVVEGSVRFHNASGEHLVKGGMQSFAAPGHRPTEPAPANERGVLAWTRPVQAPELAVTLLQASPFVSGVGELNLRLTNLSPTPIELVDPISDGSYLQLRVEHLTEGLVLVQVSRDAILAEGGGEVRDDRIALAPGESRDMRLAVRLPWLSAGKLRLIAVFGSNSGDSDSELNVWRGLEESPALGVYQSRR
jgi:hypothetical protein